MKMIQITVQIPTQNDKGEVELTSQDIVLNLEQVYFIFKPPLNPTSQIIGCLPMPLLTQDGLQDKDLIEAGLVSFDTTDGTKAWMNPRFVQFYFSPQLGVYVFVFPGGSKLGVKATNVDVQRAMGEKSIIC